MSEAEEAAVAPDRTWFDRHTPTFAARYRASRVYRFLTWTLIVLLPVAVALHLYGLVQKHRHDPRRRHNVWSRHRWNFHGRGRGWNERYRHSRSHYDRHGHEHRRSGWGSLTPPSPSRGFQNQLRTSTPAISLAGLVHSLRIG